MKAGERPPRPEGAPPRGGGPGGFAVGEVLGHAALIGVVVAPLPRIPP
ncbi:MAG: hypothetical protein HC853_13280 [Anaerolineae bacterium]|nr:hypothetical protein [Anaerolineae bacterium]